MQCTEHTHEAPPPHPQHCAKAALHPTTPQAGGAAAAGPGLLPAEPLAAGGDGAGGAGGAARAAARRPPRPAQRSLWYLREAAGRVTEGVQGPALRQATGTIGRHIVLAAAAWRVSRCFVLHAKLALLAGCLHKVALKVLPVAM